MKRLIIICVFLCSLLLISCSDELTTAIEDLSVATPTSAAAFEDDSVSSSSFVKVIDDKVEKQDDEVEKRTYREGDLISFDPIGVDPDGDVITYKFSRPLDEKGEWQTEIGDAGTYQITITASDGKTEVEKKVILLILSANRAPSIENFDDLTVKEGDLVELDPSIFDYNADELTIEYSKPFDEEGKWQTDYEDEGTYVVKLTVSDGETTVEKQITVIVVDVNRPPVIEYAEHVSVLDGDTVSFSPVVSDPDGDDVTVSYSMPVSSDGTWMTSSEDVGTYAVTITASDGEDFVEKIVTVIVNHRNLAPVISLDEVRAEETDRVVLKPVIIDPEGDDFTVEYSEPFDSDGVWVTDYDSAGTYDVVITATDENGEVGSYTVKVVIYDRNRAPEFSI